MTIVGDLTVLLSANTIGLKKGLGEVRSMTGHFSAALAKLGTVATVVAGGGVGVLTAKAFEAIDAQAKLSDQLGFQQERLAGLQHAAQLAGVSTENISRALGLLGKNVVDAASGSGEALKSFRALGLDAAKLVRLPVAEQFDRITDALGRVDNASERISIVRNIFGRSGQELLSLMKDGTAGLRAMQAEADKFGLTVSRIDSAKVEEANDAFFRVRQVISGLLSRLSVEIAPFISAASNAFIEWATSGEGAAERIHGAVHQLVKIVGLLGDAWNGVASATELAAAAALKLVAASVEYNLVKKGFTYGFEGARFLDKTFGDAERAARAVNPVQSVIDNLNGAADELVASALARSGTSVVSRVESFFRKVQEQATKRAEAAIAGNRSPVESDLSRSADAMKIGAFREVDLRRIALGGGGSSSKPQEVTSPELKQLVELTKRLVGQGPRGAVTA